MDAFERAVYMLPGHMRNEAASYGGEAVEEIRLRLGRRPTVLYGGTEHELSIERVTENDMSRVLERATGASMHSASAALSEGYISCMGLRIGVCGEGVMHGDRLSGFRSYSSLAIRIPRELRGVCNALARQLCEGGFKSSLIISAPGGGKTTALRELVRILSDDGLRIGVCDERNELSAGGGAAGFDLGRHSDVLVGIPKAEAAMLLLRGMNPQIIAMDEISRAADTAAVEQIFGCGVRLLATAHAASRAELEKRPLYKHLMDMQVFENLIIISNSEGKRSYLARKI